MPNLLVGPILLRPPRPLADDPIRVEDSLNFCEKRTQKYAFVRIDARPTHVQNQDAGFVIRDGSEAPCVVTGHLTRKCLFRSRCCLPHVMEERVSEGTGRMCSALAGMPGVQNRVMVRPSAHHGLRYGRERRRRVFSARFAVKEGCREARGNMVRRRSQRRAAGRSHGQRCSRCIVLPVFIIGRTLSAAGNTMPSPVDFPRNMRSRRIPYLAIGDLLSHARGPPPWFKRSVLRAESRLE